MNKKGSHVEIIISFIIFVTFIFFLFSIIEPSISTQKDKKNIFDSIEFGIIEKISSNMTTITANLGSGGSNCVSLTDFINDLGIGNHIIVKGASGEILSSSSNGNSLQITRGSSSDTFFKIYYSEEFDELDTGSGCSAITYDLGLTKTSTYIFQKKIIYLLDRDYETLKNELKIPEGVEFGYGIVLSNGTALETSQQELSTSVYIRETPIEYIDLDGNILEGYLKTRIW